MSDELPEQQPTDPEQLAQWLSLLDPATDLDEPIAYGVTLTPLQRASLLADYSTYVEMQDWEMMEDVRRRYPDMVADFDEYEQIVERATNEVRGPQPSGGNQSPSP